MWQIKYRLPVAGLSRRACARVCVLTGPGLVTTASAHLRPGGEYPGAGSDVLITDRAPAQHCPHTPPPVTRLSPTCYTRLTHHQHMTMGGSRGAITDKESVQYCQAEVRIVR